MSETAKIVFCRCRYADIISDGVKTAILEFLRKNNIAFESVDDLCGLCAHKDSSISRWAREKNIKIIACRKRSVDWLFYSAGVELGASAEVLDMRTADTAAIILKLSAGNYEKGEETNINVNRQDNRMPWFPVIDYSRCKNCKQCLNFCLFGVYRADSDGTVRVVNPAGCKTSCPACARVCPGAAIIFPKYSEGYISGQAVDDEAMKKEGAAANVQQLLKGDMSRYLKSRGQNVKDSDSG